MMKKNSFGAHRGAQTGQDRNGTLGSTPFFDNRYHFQYDST